MGYRRSTQIHPLACIMTLVFMSGGPATLAIAAPPDAGQLLRDAAPPPALPKADQDALPQRPSRRPPMASGDTARIAVVSLHITGNSVFRTSELSQLIGDAAGKQLTLSELNRYADRVTQYYRDRGYLVARAYIPQQDIVDGNVEIAVLEGGLSVVRLDNHSRTSAAVIQPFLDVLHVGQPLRAGPLEEQLLLISDVPGVLVTSVLKPGTDVGQSELVVTTTDGPRMDGNVNADNEGVRATGQYRGGAALNFDSPLSIGDDLGVDAQTSGHEFQYEHGDYVVPIGGYGTRIGVTGSHLDYELGDPYADLGAHGSADAFGLTLMQSLLRGYRYNIRAVVEFDVRKMRDVVDAVSSQSDKQVHEVTAALSGDGHDTFGGGGASAWSVKALAGHLGLDATTAATDLASGYRSAGDFQKVTAYAIRLQGLPHDWAVYAALSGQAAAKNLDSSEKFSVGGPFAVRAYQQGEGSADDAWVATLELRYSLTAVPGLGLAAFFDAGHARQSHDPIATDTENDRSLSGVGVNASWTLASRFHLSSFFAWRTGDAPVTDRDRSPRIGVQAVVNF